MLDKAQDARIKDARIAELQDRLAALDTEFMIEAQKRGFDPAQVANMALPTVLANLVTQRTEIESELEELGTDHDAGED